MIRIGRTHLQDATPLRFSQEISGWRELVAAPRRMLEAALPELRKLAIGGTAVGTGLNAPADFDQRVCAYLRQRTGADFSRMRNKFHALTTKDALVFAHGALKALACNLMKIANDIRWEASGPRCGIGEIHIPENEPGQLHHARQGQSHPVRGRHHGGGTGHGQRRGHRLCRLPGQFPAQCVPCRCAPTTSSSPPGCWGTCMDTFRIHCVDGVTADREKMERNLHKSLMLVTCLTPKIGYEAAAGAAKKALHEGTTLKEAVLSLGLLTAEEFDQIVRPENMV